MTEMRLTKNRVESIAWRVVTKYQKAKNQTTKQGLTPSKLNKNYLEEILSTIDNEWFDYASLTDNQVDKIANRVKAIYKAYANQ